MYPKECEKKNELVLVVGQELIQWPCSECVLWNLLLVVDATSCPSIHPSIATSCPSIHPSIATSCPSVHPFIFRSCFHSALPLGFRCCVASLSRTDKTTKPLCLCLCLCLCLASPMAMAISKSKILARNHLTASTSRLVDGSMLKVRRSLLPLFFPFFLPFAFFFSRCYRLFLRSLVM